MFHFLILYLALQCPISGASETADLDTSQYHCPPPPFLVANAYTPNYEGQPDIWIDIKYAVDFYQIELFDRWGKQVINYKNANTNTSSEAINEKFEGLIDSHINSDTYLLRLTLKPVGADTVCYCSLLTIIR